MSKSIAIVETSAVSFAELKELCREIIPNVKVTQIIDESLIQEVNQNGGPTPLSSISAPVWGRQRTRSPRF